MIYQYTYGLSISYRRHRDLNTKRISAVGLGQTKAMLFFFLWQGKCLKFLEYLSTIVYIFTRNFCLIEVFNITVFPRDLIAKIFSDVDFTFHLTTSYPSPHTECTYAWRRRQHVIVELFR